MIDRTTGVLKHAVIAMLACALPASADASTGLDAVLKRLEALEKENALLRQRVRRLEGEPAQAEKPATAAYAAARPDHAAVTKTQITPPGPKVEAGLRALYWESPGAIQSAQTFDFFGNINTHYLDIPFSAGFAGFARYYGRPGTFVEIGGHWWRGKDDAFISGSQTVGNVNLITTTPTASQNELKRDVYGIHASVGSQFAVTPWWMIEPTFGLAWIHLEDRQSGSLSGFDFLNVTTRTGTFNSTVKIDAAAARIGLSNEFAISDSIRLTGSAHALVGIANADNSLSFDVNSVPPFQSRTVHNLTGAFWGAETSLGFAVTQPWGNASATFHAQYDFVYYDVGGVYRGGTYIGTPPQNIVLHGPSAGLKITY